MADVHLACTSVLGANKLLVLKALRPGFRKDPNLVTMFIDEARIATRLNHPNVVQTYEVGLEDGGPFIAMEFLDGQPLHRVLRRMGNTPQWPLSAHLKVLCDLLTGLDHAHELTDYDGRPLEIVHRDVNPQNVFVTYEGVTKLVDFGIAKALDSEAQTEVGTFKGKLAYMAPEQTRGSSVDRRADLYAVGVMLWEALAGRRMWHSVAELELLQRLSSGDLPALPDDVEPRLAAVCERALALDPDERYESASAFRVELESALEAPTPAAPSIGQALARAFASEREELRQLIERSLSRSRGDEVTLPTGPSHASPDEPTRSLSGPMLATGDEFDGETRSIRPKRSFRILKRAVAAAVLASIGGVLLVTQWVWPTSPHDPAPPSERSERPRASASGPQPAQTCSSHGPLIELSGAIEEDLHLTCDRRYRLMFDTVVRPGVTLTIDPGTTVLGDHETQGMLVVQPQARIVAEGTADSPIVFTSSRPEGERAAGDWGGIVVLGSAPTNLTDRLGNRITGRVEGLREKGRFGGDEPDDDSGVLRYLRIEYAGVALGPSNETNGLTLAGVGRGTRVDHVQVTMTGDDCFEFFGGTVDAHHLLCDQPVDDGIDWDFGYQGNLQFVVVRASAQSDHAIEGDSDPYDDVRLPRSTASMANVTLCGFGDAQRRPPAGVSVRSSSILHLRNAWIEGFGVPFEQHRGSLDVSWSVIVSSSNAGVETTFLQPERHNRLETSDEGPCRGPAVRLAPPERIDAEQPDEPLQPAPYIGAFADEDDRWDEGWAVWTSLR